MKKKIIIVSIIVIMIMMSLSTTKIYGLLVMNDITCSFPVGSEKAGIETNVIQGSKHFLKAQTYVSSLFFEFENSTLEKLNISNSLDALNKTIVEIELAISNYTEATAIAEKIGLEETKRDMFASYDYDSLIKAYNLNNSIAETVKGYLKAFDIINLYQHNIENLKQILVTLKSIKTDLSEAKTPSITRYWLLLQQFSEANLFANYATIMGSTVLNNCR